MSKEKRARDDESDIPKDGEVDEYGFPKTPEGKQQRAEWKARRKSIKAANQARLEKEQEEAEKERRQAQESADYMESNRLLSMAFGYLAAGQRHEAMSLLLQCDEIHRKYGWMLPSRMWGDGHNFSEN